MGKLFAYGTLKDPEIQQNIFGRTLKGKSDTLVGYVVNEIKIEEEFGMVSYPIITKTDLIEDKIEGLIYEVSEMDLQQADIYEGKLYKRIEVLLESNELAWTYTATT
jgi:hypothetical protein